MTTPDPDAIFRSRYQRGAVEYAVQYFAAGRYANANFLHPVDASLFHHAIELLLKAILARHDSPEEIRRYGTRAYGHNLGGLWRRVRAHVDGNHDEFEATIEQLDRFEEIRYPEILVMRGGLITISPFDTPAPEPSNNPQSVPKPELSYRRVGRLARALFEASGFDLDAFTNLHADPDVGNRNLRKMLAPGFFPR